MNFKTHCLKLKILLIAITLLCVGKMHSEAIVKNETTKNTLLQQKRDLLHDFSKTIK